MCGKVSVSVLGGVCICDNCRTLLSDEGNRKIIHYIAEQREEQLRVALARTEKQNCGFRIPCSHCQNFRCQIWKRRVELEREIRLSQNNVKILTI